MLVTALLWLAMGTGAPAFTKIALQSQIIPSAIQTCLGTTVFWLVMTLLFGRIYCATVCPVGTLQDAVVWIRRKSGKGKIFSFQEGSSWRYRILFLYIVSLAVGVLVVGYIIEPWNIMRNAAATVHPDAIAITWTSVGISVATGILAGVTMLVVILVWAWHAGRPFCSTVCPIGAALGCVHSQTLFHIAIDPDKCISCMKCEDICPTQCIKVSERRVDNSRCVRCFDCTAVCPNEAIRFQINRGKHRSTPLMQHT